MGLDFPPSKFHKDRRSRPEDRLQSHEIRKGSMRDMKALESLWDPSQQPEAMQRYAQFQDDLNEALPTDDRLRRRTGARSNRLMQSRENLVHFDIDPNNSQRQPRQAHLTVC